jgi:hypothetical protein
MLEKLSNHKVWKFLVLLPLMLLVCFVMYFHWLTGEIDAALLSEKFIEKHVDLDIICDGVDNLLDTDNDWGSYDYAGFLQHRMSYIDALPMTFAAVYNDRLELLSDRLASYENSPFDPTAYDEFYRAVHESESGDLVLSFEPAGDAERDMYLYYRWVPTRNDLDGRFLTVVAISRHSVDTSISEWVSYGSLALIVGVFVICACPIFLWIVLGSVYGKRKGDKWRGDGDGGGKEAQ